MKNFVFIFLMLPVLAFSQRYLTKAEAYKRFKNSNVRTTLNIKLSEFNEIYNTAKSDADNRVEKMGDMLIFNSYKNKNFLKDVKDVYFWGTTLKDTRPGHERPYCDDCTSIIHCSLKDLKETKFFYIPLNSLK